MKKRKVTKVKVRVVLDLEVNELDSAPIESWDWALMLSVDERNGEKCTLMSIKDMSPPEEKTTTTTTTLPDNVWPFPSTTASQDTPAA